MNDVIGEVINERKYQDEKWGEQNHSPEFWHIILMEEVGEAAEAILEWPNFGHMPECDYRKEMIQIAAVAISAVESLDRQIERKKQ